MPGSEWGLRQRRAFSGRGAPAFFVASMEFYRYDLSEGEIALSEKTCKEEAVYLAATFGMIWLLWLGACLTSVSAHTPPLPADRLIRLGTAAPSVMGLALTRIYGGRKDLKTLTRSLVSFRASPVWWIYTVALFPFLLFISSLLFLLTGGSLPPPRLPAWAVPLAFFYTLIFVGPLGKSWAGVVFCSAG